MTALAAYIIDNGIMTVPAADINNITGAPTTSPHPAHRSTAAPPSSACVASSTRSKMRALLSAQQPVAARTRSKTKSASAAR